MLAGLISAAVAGLLRLGGSSAVGKVIDYLQKRADSETERQRIQAQRDTTMASYQLAYQTAAMGHRAFWVPWSIAAGTTSVWYAWGMLDSAWPGHLSHVAALPPQLFEFAKDVWASLFYTGAAVASAETVASTAVRIARSVIGRRQ